MSLPLSCYVILPIEATYSPLLIGSNHSKKVGEEIIKKQLWILFLSIVALLVGCVSRENDKQPISSEMNTKTASSPSAKANEELPQVLLDQISKDWNNDGEDDDIRLVGSDNPGSMQTVLVEINGHSKIELTDYQHEIGGYARFGKWIKLGPNEQGLAVMFGGDEQEPTESQPAWHKSYFWVVLGYDGNKLSVVFDTLNQPYMKLDNIAFTYSGEGNRFEFKDRFTGMEAAYDIAIEKSYRELYDPQKMPKDILDRIEPALFYNSVDAIDLNGDGIEEIVCTRYIPGFYLQHVLGLVSYIFEWNNDEYQLKKEILFKSLSYVGSDAYVPDNPHIEVVGELSI